MTTTVEIKTDTPPNWKLITDTFNVNRKSKVLYAYWPHIYNPAGVTVPVPLIHHECVHLERQKHQGVDNWWQNYCDSMQFRLAEELLAHRAEYVEICKHPHTNRHQRRSYLDMMSKRLASPLYGCQIKAGTVKSMIPAMDDPRVLAKVLAWAALEESDGSVT